MNAIPLDSEQAFKHAFDTRWALEETILSCKPLAISDLKAQLRILADRARDGADVEDHLRRLAD
jgi:hypothetical protein